MDVDIYSRVEQRKFGVVMAIAIGILGLVRWALHGFGHFPLWFFVVAAVFLALGLIAPRALQPVFYGWMKFALALNWVMTRVLLAIAFYGMITPVRILLRIFSDDPLKRAWRPDGESYWEDPEEQPAELDRYRNQF